MATTKQSDLGISEVEFSIGSTATPVDGRYCLSFDLVKRILLDFLSTGKLSPEVFWEEI
jgi:hypothetical protein